MRNFLVHVFFDHNSIYRLPHAGKNSDHLASSRDRIGWTCVTSMPSILLARSLLRTSLKSPHHQIICRQFIKNANRKPPQLPTDKSRNIVLYSTAGVLFTIAMTYAAVPLYRLYCLKSGLGGRAEAADEDKVKRMKKVEDRKLKIIFQADTDSTLTWNFKPLQHDIVVAPGETALAFYTARNPLEKPVTGVATYNVMPYEAGLYLNKIQCFCFEEQRLNPDEQVRRFIVYQSIAKYSFVYVWL